MQNTAAVAADAATVPDVWEDVTRNRARMKLDIKTLIVLAGIAITFGGFYYGTEYRLSSLEQDVKSLQQDNNDLGTKITRTIKRIKRLEK